MRIRAKNENSGTHPWMDMDDMQLLKSAGLYKKDISTGKEGITLAGILLFGKNETIQSALPHHRTDAILRKINLDRYDIRTNLIESYERLTQFIAKHLNDPFYLEGDTRVSLRNKIFREVIANILIHREYSNAYTAKMIIQKDKVVFENANKANDFGVIDPNDFTPFTKNPAIAKVFREIGYAEELGSGIKNLFKYSKLYGGSDPILQENDIFTTTIMLNDQVSDHTPQVTPQADKKDLILEFCKEAKSIQEIMKYFDLNDRKHFRTNVLNPLIKKGLITPTIPDKPKSPNQKYIINNSQNMSK